MDEDILQHAKQKYNMLIGEQTAELVKSTIGNAYENNKVKHMEVKGRDLVSGHCIHGSFIVVKPQVSKESKLTIVSTQT